MIPFNVPPYAGQEDEYVLEAIHNHKICGDGPFTKRCHVALEAMTGTGKALLTTSGSSALEMAAILCDVGPGDEVILPSFTFSSTANAFALRGATLVFADICPDTMNIDPECIRAAITERTKVIVPMHYAGVCCDMTAINAMAKERSIFVVEDAAQAVDASLNGKVAGTMSDMGCYSFHETKNFSMGEGGAILFNDPRFVERAEIIREKGTDRSRFYRGQVDKYTWVDIGSSILPSEINAAYLLAQLEIHEQITAWRMKRWNQYNAALQDLKTAGKIDLPTVPAGCKHNAHMYYIKCRDIAERTALTAFLKQREINAVFHYIPLHSAAAGRRFGRFHGEDRYTTRESERLLRLPMYYGLTAEDCDTVIRALHEFYA
ncbi:MAG TPA: dTDP-4-amino-4,6-dideoxygalactose transaminase [Candidatus Limiplasma sp.]|nr:dTDP-4-amino-4,6-dideoxygalactose transaminase [Candidatus Limiplasma sp.]HPR78054.1 dTDP-4-amino-4,6-dideoxygalactose transaminase [Candidatus Limiplasma sp.]